MKSLLLILIGVIGAQQTQIKPKTNSPDLASDTRPVTCEEASHVFTDARILLARVLHVSLGGSSIASSSTPVTREQVVGEMASIAKGFDSKVKFTPQPQSYAVDAFHIARSQLRNLERLVRLGYVGKVSPLATSPTDTLTIHQFGDALGFYLARTAEVTHTPSPKWSPILGAGSS